MTKAKFIRLIIITALIVLFTEFLSLINNNFTDFTETEALHDNDVIVESEESSNLDKVKFVRCVDGDTIIIEDASGENIRVRLIGINTPESVAMEEERNNEYGVMASDYTKALLKDTKYVYLEYDVSSDDQYDRILAYVWLEDVDNTFDEDSIRESMLNAIIVENGYGFAKRYEPTVAHDDFLQTLMNEAKTQGTGLWKYKDFSTLLK